MAPRQGNSFPQPMRGTRVLLPASALILLAAEILLLAGVAFCFLVLRVTWGSPHQSAPGLGDPIWTLLCGLTLVFGSLLLWFAKSAARQHQIAATTLVGLTCMYGIIGIALRIVDLGGRPEPYFISASEIAGMPSPSAGRPAAKATAATKGNPEKGKPLYTATCAACHGPNGQGIAGTAPAYAETDFVSKSDETTLARMIQKGRLITDPENRSKRAMPASGGNPFLTPQNLRDIAAYVKTMSSGGASATAVNAVSGPQLPNWVVPGAAMGSLGVKQESASQWSAVQLQLAGSEVSPVLVSRRASFLSALFRTWSLLHLLHIAAAAIALVAIFGLAITSNSKRLSYLQVSSVAMWWHLGTLAWLVSVGMFFVLG